MNLIPNRRTWLQFLFWGLLWISIPFLLCSANSEIHDRYFYHSIVLFVGTIIVIWINANMLVPALFFKNKFTLYVTSGLLLVGFITFLDEWDATPWEQYFKRSAPPRRPHMPDNSIRYYLRTISYVMPYLTAFISSAFIEIASYANQKAKEATEFRNEKLESEMKFLKSQFNPHFLFNALNNIYTLSVIKSEKTSDNLLKLSGMLRYMLYDCKANTVTLDKEIAYLNHFIDLHMLKDSKGLNVEVSLDESQPNLEIAPMLLVPFIENAFKHSQVEDLENGWIKINLKTTEDRLVFEVSNSIPQEDFTKDKIGGIGLENVQRQLELAYPNKHKLTIETIDGAFEVQLEIEV